MRFCFRDSNTHYFSCAPSSNALPTFSPQLIVPVMYRIIGDRAVFLQTDFTIFAEHALVYANIDDPAQIFAFINHFHKLVFQCYRKLVNDRRIDKALFVVMNPVFLFFTALFRQITDLHNRRPAYAPHLRH